MWRTLLSEILKHKTPFDIIAFDADDTLWHNESLFATTKDKLKKLLTPYCSPEIIQQRLDETEIRNLRYFGYGVKAFTLSMIESAIELTDGQIQGHEIRQLINFGKDMLTTPVRLLDHVKQVIPTLAKSYQLMIITKGDLFDQEAKIARSGLSHYFTHVEIVSNKTPEIYQAILEKYDIVPERFLMVGNSLRSDVFPVLEIGGRAIYIPYHITWVHEAVTEQEKAQQTYAECDHIGLLPELIRSLQA